MTREVTRQEHLNWCKQRAMEYVNAGDLQQGFTSMCSDLMKHEDTKHHASTNQLGMSLLLGGHLSTKAEMTKWIQGYN